MCLARPGLDPVIGPRTPLSCWLASSASCSSLVLGSVVAAWIRNEMVSELVLDLVPDSEYSRI